MLQVLSDDKLLHLIITTVLTWIFYLVFSLKVSVTLSISVGLVKEFLLDYALNLGEIDYLDVIFNLIGISLFLSIRWTVFYKELK